MFGQLGMLWCNRVVHRHKPSTNKLAEPGSEAALEAIASVLQGFSSQYSLLGTDRQHVLGTGAQGSVLR